jgi:hypothetical protein
MLYFVQRGLGTLWRERCAYPRICGTLPLSFSQMCELLVPLNAEQCVIHMMNRTLFRLLFLDGNLVWRVNQNR